jgi:serine/threonine protein kinase
MLAPGTRLEEFRIERVIGSSSFGVVYLANDEAFERHIAIKEYLPDTLSLRDADGVQVRLRAPSHSESFARGRRAFVEESQMLAACNHPSLLHVQRGWEANGTAYRAMPYYPGHSLLALRRAMTAPPDEASLRALLDGLLGALETLHDAGALHREIAPDKILLLPDDRPLLLDASAARRAIVGDEARALMTLLAPSFAPLEQTAPAPDRPQGPWTDLYALCGVVKYCISGELPPPASLHRKPAREPMAQLVQRLLEQFPHMHYSASFLAAIDAGLAPRLENRPQSVAGLRHLLDKHPPLRSPVSEREPWLNETADDVPEWPSGTGPQGGYAPVDDFGAANFSAAPAPGGGRDAPTPDDNASSDDRRDDRYGSSRFFAEPSLDAMMAELPHDEAWRGAAAAASTQPAPPTRAPAPAPPAMSARPADDRPSHVPPPVFDFAARTRRKRHRLAWVVAVLLLAAGGAVMWAVDQQRIEDAQAAFAEAAREDGLTKNLPPLRAASSAGTAAVVGTDEVSPVAKAQGALPQAPTGAVVAPPPPAPVEERISTSGTQSQRAAMGLAPGESMVRSGNDAVEPVRGDAEKNAAVSGEGPKAGNTPVKPTAAAAKAAAAPVETVSSPREACGDRTHFSLYRCMKTQCEKARWVQHPLCQRLRVLDRVE